MIANSFPVGLCISSIMQVFEHEYGTGQRVVGVVAIFNTQVFKIIVLNFFFIYLIILFYQ